MHTHTQTHTEQVCNFCLLTKGCCFADISSQAHDMLVRESFLRFFVETIGHYTEYICTQMDGEKIFEVGTEITGCIIC